jgi:GxxExxY protein
MELLHKAITDKIIRAFYNVYNELGFGFAERVYERALIAELGELGLVANRQQLIKVFYKKFDVGDYQIDILVDGKVLLELKSVEALNEAHDKQIQNYLRATPIEVGLVLNFGPKPEIMRKVFSNSRKKFKQ